MTFLRFCTQKLVSFASSSKIVSYSFVKNQSFNNFSSVRASHSNKKMNHFIYPNSTPITLLNCEDAFNDLTEKEKLYAHYLSQASWYGGLIGLIQNSSESPLIFSLLHRLFLSDSVKDLKTTAFNDCGFTEEDFRAFMIYSSGILSNLGNYKGSGDTKIIPNLSQEKFKKLILSSKFASKQPEKLEKLLSKCFDKIFSLKDNEQRLGFPSNGTTTYFSKNVDEEDMEAVKKFLKKQNIEAYNTRLFKNVDDTGRSCYEIRLASVLQTENEEEKNLLNTFAENGHNFVITRGDYSQLLKYVTDNLLFAMEHAANENEINMLKKYVQSFKTGSLDAHKDGSRFWIKNKGPIVENYIGFIETYRDPSGIRGEFEGFVAIVNKKMSVKFTNLVNSATNFIPLLPWPATYEKDTFLQPDFTSLDVLTYACTSVPAGICIPNYEEIRQSEGFKNVSLGNTIHVKRTVPPNFLSKSDEDLLMKYENSAFEVQVGLHELLGHGCGKLFMKEKDGKFNFNAAEVLNYETNEKVSSWYEEGENYDSVFGYIGSAYEECRAESVALYLCDVPDVLNIFNYENSEADNIIYTVWLSMALKGLEGLQNYDPKSNKWVQAHAQARYVLLQVMIESGEDFVKITKVVGKDGNPDLLLTMDKSKIISVGKPIIGKFLAKLQLYRATAAVNSAKEVFNIYSEVGTEGKHPFLEYREIVMARRQPTKMFVQANTFLENGKVVLRNYDSTTEGMVQSWIERFQDTTVDDILELLWEKDKKYF